MPAASQSIAGLVLAAGAGTRYGRPKALVRDADGVDWLVHTVETLHASGCRPVIAVLGAGGPEAEARLRDSGAHAIIVHATGWARGLSASLRAGLAAAQTLPAVALVVVPVDVPDLSTATVTRMISERTDAGGRHPVDADTLRQARFGGAPGHPVVLGRAHWEDLAACLNGDTGARAYLAAHATLSVECGDLGSGLDVDRPSNPV
ncbi:hypothetical protein GY21_05005 [Cryobacterium roopkundense]|uniref:Molybdenum cofactor cytidylyltransferase n=1 Tax=Cryobacterium roopkundense TaxID=1001240 RepID=A0A099JMB6_9MICO|nr:NTP transferase domain-containing protein [Cryobacterium roopkundense]KGJ79524.1 hypothetical protein GY21_05005 [Cryobacterium roopkundense]MBB5640785.1 molybdenum cofactor cytidylyltransferase [Cryobacterium roopkundense]